VRGDALPGPYVTQLPPPKEAAFEQWVKTNKIPFDLSAPTSTQDYDMRGFWQSMTNGDPLAKRGANLHFPDTYKTPYHRSFSNESQYALPIAPHWQGNKLIDKNGQVVFDEDAQKKEEQ